ncbi:MAG: tetratricopeptide repeat protein [Spirochaetales bacterium]|nr:tetratricopeptide repeat protein [Spirochaetales bacterium]
MKEKISFKDRILDIIDNFFRKRGMLIWIILGIVLVVIIGIFIWVEIEKSIRETSTIEIEKAEKLFSDWRYENDENKKEKFEENFMESISDIIKKYPDRYAAQRGLFIRAQFYSQKEEWDKAARDYLDCAESFPKAYYAADCLYNAGVCYENRGEPEEALKIYADCEEKYPESHIVGRALFSMGRIYEVSGKYREAEDIYTKLENDHSLSNWSSLAQNRKIYLKTIDRNE